MFAKKIISFSVSFFVLLVSVLVFQPQKAHAWVPCQSTFWRYDNGAGEFWGNGHGGNASAIVNLYTLRDTHNNSYCGSMKTTHSTASTTSWQIANSSGFRRSGSGSVNTTSSISHPSQGSYYWGTTYGCAFGTCLQAYSQAYIN